MTTVTATLLAVAFLLAPAGATGLNYTIYDGSSSSEIGFSMSSWGWGTTFASTTCVPTGYSYSIALSALWNGEMILRGTWGIAAGDVTSVDLWISGGGYTTQSVAVSIQSFGSTVGQAVTISDLGYSMTSSCTSFQHVSIPIAKFTSNSRPSSTEVPGGFLIANTDSNSHPIYISKFVIVGKAHSAGTVSLSVDASSSYNSRIFNSELLGVNFASSSQIKTNGYTANRWGGNTMSTYAYEYDAENHAADWYFECLANSVSDESKLPYGSSSDAFVNSSVIGGARTVFTLPTIGWVPKSRTTCCSYPKSDFPSQTAFDTYQPTCGNGISSSTSTYIGTANASRCHQKVNATYSVKFMDHLVSVFGSSLATDALWLLDNEPNYWHSTHADVHPTPVTYDELWSNTKTYALKIKEKYPNAVIGAPDLAGVCYLWGSAKDVNSSCINEGSDAAAHDDLTLLEWYIKQVGDYYTSNGVKVIDYFDFHAYPEQVYSYSSSNMLKNMITMRSLRELWDESYATAAWHNRYMGILRWISRNITEYAPWLKVSVTEYSWALSSSDTTIGAICDAEAIAVFAREGVDLATRWEVPDSNTKTEYSFRLFNGVAGAHSLTGSSVLNVTSPDVEAVTAYSFLSSSYLWVLLFNKQPYDSLSVSVSLSGATFSSTGTVYTLSDSYNATKTGSVTISSSKFTVSLPIFSAVLVEIPLSGTAQASASSNSPVIAQDSSSSPVVAQESSVSTACSLSSYPSSATGWGTCTTSVASGSSCSFECDSGYSAVEGTCNGGSWTTSPSCTASAGDSSEKADDGSVGGASTAVAAAALILASLGAITL